MEFIKAETDHVTGLIGKSGTRPRHGLWRVPRDQGLRKHATATMRSRARRWRSRGAATSAITWPISYIRKAHLIATDIDAAKLKSWSTTSGRSPSGGRDLRRRSQHLRALRARRILNDQTIPQLK